MKAKETRDKVLCPAVRVLRGCGQFVFCGTDVLCLRQCHCSALPETVILSSPLARTAGGSVVVRHRYQVPPRRGPGQAVFAGGADQVPRSPACGASGSSRPCLNTPISRSPLP